MVARVDRALVDDLGVEDGLAAENVYVLDPCCGTGAYLAETLRRITHNLEGKGLGIAGQRSGQSGGPGTGGAERGHYRCAGGGDVGLPLMATGIPGRPSLTRDAVWLPGCRDARTKPTFPRRTS